MKIVKFVYNILLKNKLFNYLNIFLRITLIIQYKWMKSALKRELVKPFLKFHFKWISKFGMNVENYGNLFETLPHQKITGVSK